MNLETFGWLLSDAGQALLADAEAGDLRDAARLASLERLRRLATPERAAAAYEIAVLRRRAATKFPHAGRMYFTRDALEQASGARIASHRAARYRARTPEPGRVADLCCGVGGDTLALAQIAPVVAVDIDPLRLAMARANADALGTACPVEFLQRDLGQEMPPECRALFFDPARRSNGRRLFRLAEYRPPVALTAGWRAITPAIGIKVAPGIDYGELASLGPLEAEFISVDGELKEAALWLGPLGQPGTRASALREGSEAHSLFAAAGTPMPPAPLATPGQFLLEPDPAVIRAQLVTLLANEIGAAQIDPTIAYLTADAPIDTPWARRWRIIEWMPFSLKRLQGRVRTLGAGAVTVKKRGSAIDTDALARRLSGAGQRELVVVLTLVAGRPAALICEGPLLPGIS
jgi:SAM-dependent methyltransferase